MTVDSLADQITKLRSLTQMTVQANWHQRFAEFSIADAVTAHWQDWAVAPLNSRDHIAWSRGRQEMWLGQNFIVPPALQGYPLTGLTLRLSLTWWAEAISIFVNGVLVQEGDLFDCSARIRLSERVKPGESIAVLMRLVSPGHDEGALVKSLLVYERADGSLNPPEPSFVADELAVVQGYLTQFAPQRLGELTAIVADLGNDAENYGENYGENGDQLDQALVRLRQKLLPWSAEIQARSLQLVGHAHLDLAWLWDIAETWRAAERTFQSVLQLQQDFPELIFCHSSPALYEWIETNRPELFAEIQTQVAAGRWEIVAGLWVEPELNLIDGESLVRQVLYGQRYVREKFGRVSRVAWLPDSFGFCGQLPQVLQQCEVAYFVTQKLRWNDSTQFPHEIFRWQSPDRSQLFSLNSAPIGEGIDPVKMANYAWDWEAKTSLQQSMWLPGVGDHGGGPTRDMLQVARRWQQSPFFPQISFGKVEEFLDKIAPQENVPVWDEDLYLEFHRGCYTTHADQKLRNRRCESLLYEAELFAAIATLLTHATYPKTAIESAWKKVLFNQFHDILPGSAIPEVYEDANQFWTEAETAGRRIKEEALGAIAAEIQASPVPPGGRAIAVFNSLNWARSAVVEVERSEGNWRVYDGEGRSLPTVQTAHQISFWAEDIPALGYRCFWICPTEVRSSSQTIGFTLENPFLRVAIDPETGHLSSVWDKLRQWEVLGGAGNQIQAFRDEGQYWDAWNIAPDYANHPLPVELLGIEPAVQNELASQIQVVWKIGSSVLQQTYSLQHHSPLLKIQTRVDWWERHVLVKAAFPLNLEADEATYEVPLGVIRRPTRRVSARHKAQWEVPALRWADLSSGAIGVGLLNDCKYGYDAEPSQLRLTLLRGAEWPNPGADLGIHEFAYGLCPHGDWRSLIRQGYEFNLPLSPVELTNRAGKFPAVGQFMDVPGDNLVMMAFKQSEDDLNQWVLRCYECYGESAKLSWENSACLLSSHLNHPQLTNLLEEPVAETLQEVAPWKIASFLFEGDAIAKI